MFDLWKLQDYAPGAGLAAGAHLPKHADSGWIPVPVPGDVHQALIDAGRIEDPFYDRNEEKCAWMEEREWWYRTTFMGPLAPRADERLELTFHGLDTFVTIWLNGVELGRHENMFRPAVFDVSALLRSGEQNTLALCFHPPLTQIAGMDIRNWGDRQEPRVAMRKAQFGYGWDWGPRLPTIGIWRPVELRRCRQATLQGVHCFTADIDAERSSAVVAVRVEVERFAGSAPLTATIRLQRPGKPEIKTRLTLSGDGPTLAATAYLTVPNPDLWWTHDLGEPSLYDLSVTLRTGNILLDEQQSQVGIRTIALDQSPDPDEPGTRFFRFVLNGVPIFAKGADWIPAHSFVGAITDERYAMLLHASAAANMNMLRIWGGGIYEHDIFYDLCDQLGILIWQDCMFACAMYPEEPPRFVAEVAAEMDYQVRRLRSHPSMALWCGNNENQWIHDMANWDKPVARAPGDLYYDTIIPDAVRRWDGRIPYWPGSPYGGNDFNSQDDGDVHNWNAWHGNSFRRFGERPLNTNTPNGVSYRRYGEDRGRFISEFGMHAAPVFETLARNIPADQLYHHSPSMDHHNKDNPKNKGDNLMLATTGLPTTLEQYIDFSMIAQAEGLKFGIEHYRQRKPHCSGTLFWQLNDCWPVLSWAVIDYYGFGKAGYYYARRVYAPVLASFKALDDGGAALWITNDRLATVADRITVSLRSFDGDVLWSEEVDVQVDANGNAEVWRKAGSDMAVGPDRYLVVHSQQGVFAANRHFFGEIKDLAFAPAVVTMEVDAVSEYELRIHLSSDRYAYFVHLLTSDETTAFDDNYIDLEPGVTRTLTVSNQQRPLSATAIQVRWLNRAV